MAVTFRIELICECENCLDQLLLDQIDLDQKATNRSLRRVAIKSGWLLVGNKCWCPECQVDKKRNKIADTED